MANKTKTDVIRLEKKRVNKVGLVILFIVLLCALVGGSYYAIKHPDFIKSLFHKENYDPEVKRDSEGNIIGTGDLVNIEMDDSPILTSLYYEIILNKVELSNNGYNLFFTARLTDQFYQYINVTCEDILIDGFSTGLGFEMTAKPNEEGSQELFIKKTLLAELEMTQFDKLTFYLKIDYMNSAGIESTEYSAGSVLSTNMEKANNVKSGLMFLDEKADLEMYYYKILNDKDNYYLYFLVKNTSTKYRIGIEVDKLIINNELYNYEELGIVTQYNSSKVFYLKIPKKNYSKIENFKVSFFLIVNRSIDKLDNAIYIVNSNIVNL